MTRRERLERRADRRREWADNRRRKAAPVFERAAHFRGDHAFNFQPGHIPERARLIAAEDRACRDLKMADHHDSRAAGIEAQLDRAIFDDDPDAIEQLEARIAERQELRDAQKRANAAWRKAGKPAPWTGGPLDYPEPWRPVVLAVGEALAKLASTNLLHAGGRTDSGAWSPYSWAKPFDLTNLGASIRRDQERLELIRRQQARTEKAESAGGVTVEGSNGYCSVTFAEKPEREILTALKAAGFRWSKGSWYGPTDRLPECVAAEVGR